jgi:predicted HD phosphohydrolase
MNQAPFTSVDECVTVLAQAAHTSDEPEIDGLAHALQCGAILRAEYPTDLELAISGLVHDIADAVTPDDHTGHDRRGAELVRPLLGDRVARLVGMHVVAKRYLVTREPRYRAALSDRSVETLAEQGDTLPGAAIDALPSDPDFEAMLALRRADDRAKDPHARVPELATWRADLERCARGVG